MTGADVRALRKRLALTQVELAAKVGVTANSVARWERDEMAIRPSAVLLMEMLVKQGSVSTSMRRNSRSKRRGR